MAGSGWLWLALAGSGVFWMALDGSGWLWVIPLFSNTGYFSNPKCLSICDLAKLTP